MRTLAHGRGATLRGGRRAVLGRFANQMPRPATRDWRVIIIRNRMIAREARAGSGRQGRQGRPTRKAREPCMVAAKRVQVRSGERRGRGQSRSEMSPEKARHSAASTARGQCPDSHRRGAESDRSGKGLLGSGADPFRRSVVRGVALCEVVAGLGRLEPDRRPHDDPQPGRSARPREQSSHSDAMPIGRGSSP